MRWVGVGRPAGAGRDWGVLWDIAEAGAAGAGHIGVLIVGICEASDLVKVERDAGRRRTRHA
jgi:hypothetical protein